MAGISAVIFGFLADSKGRKRLAVAGFAMLGLGYGILGFANGSLLGWWLYTFIDGITWGALVVIFIFSMWGDIAEGRRSEKIYAVGIMPYLLSTFIRFSLGNYLASSITAEGIGTIFSYFSFFLFIAVLPLLIAPETMSELTIKNNDLKSYINKAQKRVAKVQEKKNKPEEKSSSQDQSEKQSDVYEKARELAEKYY